VEIKGGWPRLPDHGASQLLDNPDCDIVNFWVQLDLANCDCSYESQQQKPATLEWLQILEEQLHHPDSGPCIEVDLQLMCGLYKVDRKDVPVIRFFPGSVTKLLVTGRVGKIGSLEPFRRLQHLVYEMSGHTGEVEAVCDVIEHLPCLKEVTVEDSGLTNSSRDLTLFLNCFPALPNLSVLKVHSRGDPVRLVSSQLIHITALELGKKVRFGTPPTNLQKLTIKEFSMETHRHMMAAVRRLPYTINIELSGFGSQDLMELPDQQQYLRLFSSVHAGGYYSVSTNGFSKALGRLTHLQVLHMGDFLTDTVVEILAPSVFPYLHTFGFTLPCQHPCGIIPSKCVKVGPRGERFLIHSSKVSRLARTFPVLTDLVIHDCLCEGDAYGHAGVHYLECTWMTRKYFPCLRGITSKCVNSSVELQDLPRSCHACVQ